MAITRRATVLTRSVVRGRQRHALADLRAGEIPAPGKSIPEPLRSCPPESIPESPCPARRNPSPSRSRSRLPESIPESPAPLPAGTPRTR